MIHKRKDILQSIRKFLPCNGFDFNSKRKNTNLVGEQNCLCSERLSVKNLSVFLQKKSIGQTTLKEQKRICNWNKVLRDDAVLSASFGLRCLLQVFLLFPFLYVLPLFRSYFFMLLALALIGFWGCFTLPVARFVVNASQIHESKSKTSQLGNSATRLFLRPHSTLLNIYTLPLTYTFIHIHSYIFIDIERTRRKNTPKDML